MTRPVPPIENVEAHSYRIPTPTPEADGTLAWDSTTMVTAVVSAGDVSGIGWTYADTSCAELITGILAPVIIGQPVLDVPHAWQAMQHRIRNLGRPGLVSCAMSAVDIALWDAAARCLDVSIADLLGRCRDSVEIYGSGGFTNLDDDQLTEQLRGWVDRQKISRVKIKIGGSRIDEDLRRVALTRDVVGDRTELFTDANGAYTVGQAGRMAAALADLGVSWFEEPVSSDDLAGLQAVRSNSLIDIAAGEYGYDLPYFRRMLDADAVDVLQADVTRCGGITDLLRVDALCRARSMPLSLHCSPTIHAGAGPALETLVHMEYFHDHVRIEQMLLDGAPEPRGGVLYPALDRPGLGVQLRERDAERYAA
jgi:L-alanine-DL-glutamate epimerase-like enolase superfamily enzyme